MKRSETFVADSRGSCRGPSSSTSKPMSSPFELVRPKRKSTAVSNNCCNSENNHDDMSIDLDQSDSLRSTCSSLSSLSISRPSNRAPKKVSFCPAVSMRCVLIDPIDKPKLYYNESDIKSMKADAMDQIATPLRHSLHPETTSSRDVIQTSFVQESTNSPAVLAARMPRVMSAAAEFSSTLSSAGPDPRELRYQKLLAEIDREYKIDMTQRRKSMRRRNNHYCHVLDEQDRQEDASMFDAGELAAACGKLSKVALVEAIKTAKGEATVAKAILLEGRLKEAIR